VTSTKIKANGKRMGSIRLVKDHTLIEGDDDDEDKFEETCRTVSSQAKQRNITSNAQKEKAKLPITRYSSRAASWLGECSIFLS
jgi:hypothetical protein